LFGDPDHSLETEGTAEHVLGEPLATGNVVGVQPHRMVHAETRVLPAEHLRDERLTDLAALQQQVTIPLLRAKSHVGTKHTPQGWSSLQVEDPADHRVDESTDQGQTRHRDLIASLELVGDLLQPGAVLLKVLR